MNGKKMIYYEDGRYQCKALNFVRERVDRKGFHRCLCLKLLENTITADETTVRRSKEQ
jgi:hypothetical protein